MLMTSPLSKDLFHRAIGQSGPVILVGDPLTLEQAEKRGEKLTVGWNVASGASLKELRALSRRRDSERSSRLLSHARAEPGHHS